jgi:hypothetical protein
VEMELHIDREICVHREHRTQMNVTQETAPPKEHHKREHKCT